MLGYAFLKLNINNILYFTYSFNLQVVSICEADDHDKTGRWVVKTRPSYGRAGPEVERQFDAVIVASGNMTRPHVPDIPG